MERLADAMVDRVIDVAPTRLVELELGVEKELVRQLLIGQTTGERRVRTDPTRHRSHRPTRSAVLVEISESLDTCNLLQLGPQTLDLAPELNLELGVLGFVGWKVLLRLVECDEGVLDAAVELGLVMVFAIR